MLVRESLISAATAIPLYGNFPILLPSFSLILASSTLKDLFTQLLFYGAIYFWSIIAMIYILPMPLFILLTHAYSAIFVQLIINSFTPYDFCPFILQLTFPDMTEMLTTDASQHISNMTALRTSTTHPYFPPVTMLFVLLKLLQLVHSKLVNELHPNRPSIQKQCLFFLSIQRFYAI